jgi:hypothetical protein
MYRRSEFVVDDKLHRRGRNGVLWLEPKLQGKHLFLEGAATVND